MSVIGFGKIYVNIDASYLFSHNNLPVVSFKRHLNDVYCMVTPPIHKYILEPITNIYMFE